MRDSKLSWNVLFENFNKREIIYYDIFKGGYYEQIARVIVAVMIIMQKRLELQLE